MKVALDYTKSARQIPPPGEAVLKFKKYELKQTAKLPPRPMLVIQWNIAHMDGIPGDLYDRVLLYDNIMLTEEALFKIRQLMAACGQKCECADCQNEYSADPNDNPESLGACPSCGSFRFGVDYDFIKTAMPRAQITVEPDDKGGSRGIVKNYIKQL